MAKLTLTEAFAKYGATLKNPQSSVSAWLADGSLVVAFGTITTGKHLQAQWNFQAHSIDGAAMEIRNSVQTSVKHSQLKVRFASSSL
jgi:hypothetical protein